MTLSIGDLVVLDTTEANIKNVTKILDPNGEAPDGAVEMGVMLTLSDTTNGQIYEITDISSELVGLGDEQVQVVAFIDDEGDKTWCPEPFFKATI